MGTRNTERKSVSSKGFWKALDEEGTVGVGRDFRDRPWDAPAFRVIDDIYYVGNRHVSSHLITSDEGHIIIDACNPGDGPYILKGIIDLGFNPQDIQYILLTHAHGDHTGSTKFLADETGAKVCIGEADVEACEKPNEFWQKWGISAFKVDKPLKDGDIISLGDKKIRVYDTPGHTRGCVSFGWTMKHEGKTYNAFIFGGPGAAGLELVRRGMLVSDELIEARKKTMDMLGRLKVDVWLGPHPFVNRTFEKLGLLRKGVRPNPYIDPEGWKSHVRDTAEKDKQYSKERLVQMRKEMEESLSKGS